MSSSMEEVAAFYDALADDYTAIFEDWDRAVARQGELIDGLIRRLAPAPGAPAAAPRRDLLDATCGIGTQAIGLALRGHRVTATDLSPASVDRGRLEASRLGAKLAFEVADVRTIARDVPGPFDVAISFDNALPHLVGDEDLAAALSSLRRVLRTGGLFLASIRDYDAAIEARSRGEPPRITGPEGARRMVAQAWAWSDTGRTYRLHEFIGREGPGGRWTLRHLETTYRALRRSELAAAVAGAGFGEVGWLEPSESGYYQPILFARAP